MAPRGDDARCDLIDDCRTRIVSDSEFKGAVKADLSHLKESTVGLWGKFDELSKSLNSLQIKIAGIVGGVMVLAEVIKYFLRK